MKQAIKFSVNAVRWFDRVNGNTYHSVRVTRTKDGFTVTTRTPYHYGSGDSYRQTALELMSDVKWLPVKYRGRNGNGSLLAYMYERENNYPILWNVSDGLKREMVANGTM